MITQAKCIVCSVAYQVSQRDEKADFCSNKCYNDHLNRHCKQCKEWVPLNVSRSPFCSTQCMLDYFVYLCYEITGKTCV